MTEREQILNDIKEYNLNDIGNMKKYISKLNNRKTWLKQKYKITINEYEVILKSQDGLCAICKKKETQKNFLSIDHCHISNKIRGLLCSGCNKALGFINDDIRILKSMIEYLSK